MADRLSGAGARASSGNSRAVFILIGCALLPLAAILSLAGIMFSCSLFGVGAANALRSRFFSEALAGGDPAAAYSVADPEFRAAYSPEQLEAYFRAHPQVFEPPRSSVALRARTSPDGRTLVATAFEAAGTRYVIYAVKDGGRLRLLGIGPGLDDAVPDVFVREAAGETAPEPEPEPEPEPQDPGVRA